MTTGFEIIDALSDHARGTYERLVKGLEGVAHPELVLKKVPNNMHEQEVYSPSFENGGYNRFVIALATGIAAVNRDERVTSRVAFAELSEHLREEGWTPERDDSIEATRDTVTAAMAGGLACLEGLAIDECAPPQDRVNRKDHSRIPLYSPDSALVVASSWAKIGELEGTHSKLRKVPLWVTVTGGERIEPSYNESGEDPQYASYMVAYPVRERGSETDEGFSKPMPGITFDYMFCDDTVPVTMKPGASEPNIAYEVTRIKQS